MIISPTHRQHTIDRLAVSGLSTAAQHSPPAATTLGFRVPPSAVHVVRGCGPVWGLRAVRAHLGPGELGAATPAALHPRRSRSADSAKGECRPGAVSEWRQSVRSRRFPDRPFRASFQTRDPAGVRGDVSSLKAASSAEEVAPADQTVCAPPGLSSLSSHLQSRDHSRHLEGKLKRRNSARRISGQRSPATHRPRRIEKSRMRGGPVKNKEK
jgi:hypothetical protein